MKSMCEQQFGGYEQSIFITEPSDDCICGICLNVIKEPRQCNNGHCFCNLCISRCGGAKCPVCKVMLPNLMARNLFLETTIGKMMVRCISCSSLPDFEAARSAIDKCEWTGPLNNYQSHYEKDCKYFKMKCTNKNCDVILQRKHLSQHLESTCEWRQMNCIYCKELMYVKDHKWHSPRCTKPPMICPNVGCGLTLSQYELKTHKCPQALHRCPLFLMGTCGAKCDGLIRRCDMSTHLKEGSSGDVTDEDHLHLICQLTNYTVTQHKNMNGYLHTLHENDKKSKASIKRLENENEAIEKEINNLIQKVDVLTADKIRQEQVTGSILNTLQIMTNRLAVLEQTSSTAGSSSGNSCGGGLVGKGVKHTVSPPPLPVPSPVPHGGVGKKKELSIVDVLAKVFRIHTVPAAVPSPPHSDPTPGQNQKSTAGVEKSPLKHVQVPTTVAVNCYGVVSGTASYRDEYKSRNEVFTGACAAADGRENPMVKSLLYTSDDESL